MTLLFVGRVKFLLATAFEVPLLPYPFFFEQFDPNLKSERVQIRCWGQILTFWDGDTKGFPQGDTGVQMTKIKDNMESRQILSYLLTYNGPKYKLITNSLMQIVVGLITIAIVTFVKRYDQNT